MRAAVITKPGGPEVFEIQEIDDPKCGNEDVLVQVKASALNRADTLQRKGRYPSPVGIRSDVPGLEMSGIVLDVGSLVQGFNPGDRVFGLLGGGGYAEKVVTNQHMIALIPGNLNFEEAASIPEVFITAFDAIVNQCQLEMGESVLIHAVGSGVGTAAVQIAKSLGVRTFGTSGSDEKLSYAKDLGLDVPINYHKDDFSEVISKDTNDQGVDVVLDVIGAPYWYKNIQSLSSQGRLVLVGTMGGSTLEIDFGQLMQKRLKIFGTVLRARSMPEKMALNQQFIKNLLPLISIGKIRPIVDKIFPLEKVSDAHIYMESNKNFGKIVLSIS